MAERAGVVSVDVEPGLQGIGSKIDGYMRSLKPFGFKAELVSKVSDDLGRESKLGQKSLDSISTTKAQGQLNQLGSTGDRELGRLGSKLNLTGAQMGIIGAAAVGVGVKILGSLRPAVDAASDLGEASSYAAQVFGDSFKEIDKFAAGAATTLGQSKQEAIEGATTFATFGKAAGLAGGELVGFSTGLVKLATDMASAKNTSTADAITAIGAALRGESEPIRNYGVLLDDATLRQEALSLGIIATSKDALTPQQKVLAAQSAIFKQTKDSQDDFKRTSDGLAGSQKIAAAEAANAAADFGEKLAPALAAVTSAGAKALGVLNSIPGATATVGVGVAALGGVSILGGVVTSILGARRAIGEYRADLAKTATETGRVGFTGSAAFGKLGGAIKIAGGVLAAVGITEGVLGIVNSLKEMDRKGRDALNSFAGAAGEAGDQILAGFNEIARVEDNTAELSAIWKSVGTEFKFAGQGIVRDIEYFQQAFEKISTTQPVEQVRAFIDAARAQNDQLDHSSTAYKETKKLLDVWAESTGLAEKAQGKQTKATQLGADALDKFGFKIDEMKGKYGQYIDALNNTTDPFQNATDATDERIKATKDVADAEAEVSSLRAGGVKDSNAAAEAERKLADATESVVSAKRSQAAAYRDLANANRDLADLEADLAHVDPNRDPNRYRELSEKVRDAKDSQLNAQDRVASAADSVRSSEQSVVDARKDQAGTTDDLASAEGRLEDARKRQRDAVEKEDAALAALNDEVDKHPDLLKDSFDAIDQYAKRNGLAADEVARWKWAEIDALAAAQARKAYMDANPEGGGGASPTTKPTGSVGPVNPAHPLPGREVAPKEKISYAEGVKLRLHARKFDPAMQLWSDTRDGKTWYWVPSLNAWARYAMGGLVDGTGDTDTVPIMATPGEFVVTKSQVQRLGAGNLAALNDGRAKVVPLGGGATASTPSGGAATVTAASPTESATVVELRALRGDLAALTATVGNLANVTYAPTIHARPDQVRPTMAESLRASRADSWTEHGRVLTGV